MFRTRTLHLPLIDPKVQRRQVGRTVRKGKGGARAVHVPRTVGSLHRLPISKILPPMGGRSTMIFDRFHGNLSLLHLIYHRLIPCHTIMVTMLRIVIRFKVYRRNLFDARNRGPNLLDPMVLRPRVFRGVVRTKVRGNFMRHPLYYHLRHNRFLRGVRLLAKNYECEFVFFFL